MVQAPLRHPIGQNLAADGASPKHSGRRVGRLPRRVLMVAPQPCFDLRGTPMNVLQMCRALLELGYEVHLATYPFGETISLSGLVYHRVGRPPLIRSAPIGFSWAKLILDGLLILKVWRLLLSGRYIVVHAIEEAAFFAIPAARLFATPTISDLDSDLADQLGEHGSAAVRFLSGPTRWMQRSILRQSTCAVTMCRAMTDLVEALSPGKAVFQIEDIPLPSADRPPDAQTVARLRRELGLKNRRVILYTGNLEPYQGVELLIDALPMVVQACPEAAVVVVGGERDQVKALRQRAALRGVDDSLRMVGKKPSEMISEFMGLAEVLASPRREGHNTPLKVYTYMLSGRPIVATDLPTHTQVLDSRTAILTPVSAEGTAAGLIRALKDARAAADMGRLARQKVRRDHNYATFQRKIGQAYAFATGGAGGAFC